MVVKICGITNREDAIAAVDAGATALGFNFYPKSPRYIAPEDAATLIDLLPAKVWKVGVFVNHADAAEIARRIGLDILQLHGAETSAPEGFRVWKAVRVNAEFRASAYDQFPAEALLLDGPASGKTFDWSLA